MNPRTLLLLLAPLLLLRGNACAATDEATKQLKSWVDEVVAVAENSPSTSSLAAGVRPILLNCISFDSMTRHAVGPGWRQFSTDQQKEAVRLFSTLIIRTYTGKFTPGMVPVITFKPASSPSPGRVESPTTLLYKGGHYDVTYRQEEAEGWRITDVVIEGVSMIANYRTQFDAQFKDGGAVGVINALTRSVNSPQ